MSGGVFWNWRGTSISVVSRGSVQTKILDSCQCVPLTLSRCPVHELVCALMEKPKLIPVTIESSNEKSCLNSAGAAYRHSSCKGRLHAFGEDSITTLSIGVSNLLY